MLGKSNRCLLYTSAPVFSPIHLAYFAFHGRANPDDPADGTEGDTYLPFEYNESDGDKKFAEDVYKRQEERLVRMYRNRLSFWRCHLWRNL